MKYQTILTCNAIFLITFNFASYWQNKINTQVTLYLSDVNTVCHFISFKDRSQTIGESQKPLNCGIATIAEQTVSIIIADDHTSDNLLPRIFLWLSDIAESTYYTVGIREYERTWQTSTRSCFFSIGSSDVSELDYGIVDGYTKFFTFFQLMNFSCLSFACCGSVI